MFWIICPCQLICKNTVCVQNIRHQHARMLCIHRSRHFVNVYVNDELLQCCAKRMVGAIAIYCDDVM